MEDKYFSLFREEIFLRHVSPFSRENSLPSFCVVILRREILKLFTTKRRRFNPALCNNSAERIDARRFHSVRTLSYNVCLTAVNFRHAYPPER